MPLTGIICSRKIENDNWSIGHIQHPSFPCKLLGKHRLPRQSVETAVTSADRKSETGMSPTPARRQLEQEEKNRVARLSRPTTPRERALERLKSEIICGEGGSIYCLTIRLCTSQDPDLQAVKIPEATAAVVTKSARLGRLPTWQVTKVKSKEEEVIEKAQKEVMNCSFCRENGHTPRQML